MAHLLFVTPAFPPLPGGGERYARSLALALLRAGHQITVVTSKAEQERDFWQGTAAVRPTNESDQGLQIWRCPLAPFPAGRRGLLAWRKLMVVLSALPGDQTSLLLRMTRLVPPLQGIEATLARQQNVDLVHGFNISWEHALVAAWQFARERRLPYVLTPFAHLGEGRRSRVARNSMMDHQRHILAGANAVHVLTRIEAEGFRFWGLQPREIVEVGGGVDPPPVIGEKLAAGSLPKPFVLFLGRASYDKGAIHAVEAVQQVRGEGYDLNLVLAGQTTAELDRFLQRQNDLARASIHQLGLVDEVTKHGLLAEATALLLPSRTDSFGIVLLEAWQHGTPVVGAAVGGIQGVVDGGENGLLVPFGDVTALAAAIRLLLDEPARGEALGRCGQAKVTERYTWERVRERVLESYRRLGLSL